MVSELRKQHCPPLLISLLSNITLLQLAVQLLEPRPQLRIVFRHDAKQRAAGQTLAQHLCLTEGEGLALRHAQTHQ